MTRSVLSPLGILGSPLRLLEVSAYVVIVAWGIRAASEILSVVLLSLFLAFVYLPLPKWLIRRFHLRKALAVSLGVVFVALLYLIFSVGLFEAGFKMRERLPIYEEHLASLYHQLVVFLSAHGIQSSALSSTNFYSSERIMTFISFVLPTVVGLFSDRVLVGILSLIFLFEIAGPTRVVCVQAEVALLRQGRPAFHRNVRTNWSNHCAGQPSSPHCPWRRFPGSLVCFVFHSSVHTKHRVPHRYGSTGLSCPSYVRMEKGHVCDHRTHRDANGFGLHSST